MMTAKKHWIKKIYRDSQVNSKYTQAEIYWSSSDSENEPGIINTKSKKTIEEIEKWINPLSPLKNKRKKLEDESNECFCQSDPDSPVIGNLSLIHASPVLRRTGNTPDSEKSGSPILGKRTSVRKLRSRKNAGNLNERESPDLFSSQYSCKISSAESPVANFEHTSTQLTNSINHTLSQLNSQADLQVLSQKTTRIDPFPSQESSQIKMSDSDFSTLYHNPPKKKKRYKKGGLAHTLQKALRLQKTRASIWQHEIFLNKDCNITCDLRDILNCSVKCIRKEYGCILLECRIFNDGDSSLDSNEQEVSLLDSNADEALLSENNGKAMSQTILVVFAGNSSNIQWEKTSRFKIYPPYSKKTILYNNSNVFCYFNVSKYILCKKRTENCNSSTS